MDEHDDHTSEEEQERVRRLLAAASSPPDPEMPEDVSARLDDVLASLASERAEPAPDAGPEAAVAPDAGDAVTAPTELASRRRRRWPRLLAAAAAVSVIGLGIGNLVDDMAGVGGGGEAASTADSAGDAGSAPQREGAPEAGDQADNKSLSGSVTAELHTSSLRGDAQRVENRSVARPVTDDPEAWSEACVQPATGPGDEWVRARLDGVAAVLVLRAPEGGRRTADVFTCDDAVSPAASTTVVVR